MHKSHHTSRYFCDLNVAILKKKKFKSRRATEYVLSFLFFGKVQKKNKSFKMIRVSKFLFTPLSLISY